MSTDFDLDPETLERVPIFPLGDAVLFPNTLLPLHIFEPRYRAMMEYILEQGCPLVIAHLQPGFEEDYDGRPPIYPVAGLGRVLQHKRLPDGRYDLLVHGIGRVRLAEELLPAQSFRLGRFEAIAPPEVSPGALDSRLAALQGLVLSVSRVRPRLAGVLSNVISQGPSPQAVGDVLSSLVLTGAEARQRALETDRIEDRLDQVFDVLLNLLPAEGFDPESVS